MPDTATIEGTIKKVTKKDGEAFGLTLDGHEGYLNYTKSEYRQQPWDPHKEGDYVKLAVSDGKWISRIKVTAAGQAQNGTHPPSGDRESHIARSVALKAAVDFAGHSMIGSVSPSDVVMNAEFFLSFLEGAQQPTEIKLVVPDPEPPDPEWE